MFRARFALSFAAFAGISSLASANITIEDVLSPPFPTELCAAPAGGAVAWVFYERGERNVWVASPPDYHAHKITNFTGDDGQEITGLRWLPNSQSLIFVRGGAPNGSGELPNPISNPAGVERAIWRAYLDGTEPVRLAEGYGPEPSPDGRSIAFGAKGEAWLLALDGPKPEPTSILKGRGGIGSLTWSPDGGTIAFVSDRGDHAFVGVLDITSKEVVWLGPGVDDDGSPVWSRDSAHVAFVRVPSGSFGAIFRSRRTDTPWSIHVGDASSGEAKEIFRADEGIGSAFWPTASRAQLLWTDGGRIVFPWEKDGWLHLYSIPTSGGGPELLTPGAFEVEEAVADGNEIVFTSNQDDIDRRHIWRVSAKGGNSKAITRGDGIEWSPAPLSDGKGIAILRSDAQMPARPAIKLGNGDARDLAPETMPERFLAREFVTPRAVTISAADGMAIPAQLFLPKGAKAGDKRPAAIFFHGGSRRQMLLGWHQSTYYHNAYGLNQYLAGQGFVVLAVNYRSGTGYGMEFREALNYGAGGASEFNDVLGAGLYLRSRPEVDSARIGLWGGSYGGFLTAMGLARASDLFAAGVDVHGVHDWNVVIRNFVPNYDPLREAEIAKIARESSPMTYTKDWRSPVLLIHGDDDRNVPFSETVGLVKDLRSRGVEFEQLIFPDEVHGFLLHSNWISAYEATAGFLKRKLGK